MPDYQYALPHIPTIDGQDKVPVYPKQKGDKPLALSQSKSELLINALQNPSLPVKDPKQIALDQHMHILAGLAIHEIAQITSFWWNSQPPDNDNHVQNYLSNLQALRHLIPTAHPTVVRRMIHFLDNERLAMTRSRSTIHDGAKRTVYALITDKVLSWLKSQPPFVATPAFPHLAHEQDLNTQLPFPAPELIQAKWHSPDRSGLTWDQKVHAMADNLRRWHKSKIVHPVDYTYKYGGAFHEVRYSSVYFKYNLIWSGRSTCWSSKNNYNTPNRSST